MPFFCKRATKEDRTKKQLPLPSGLIRLDSLSRLIAHESYFVFAFSASKLKPEKNIVIPDTIMTLDDLLLLLKEKYKISNKIIGNHIILYKRNDLAGKIEPSHRSEVHRPSQKIKTVSHGEGVAATPTKSKPTDSISLPVVVSGVTFTTPSLILPKEANGGFIISSLIPQAESAKSDSYFQEKKTQLLNNRQKSGKGIRNRRLGQENSLFYASAGLATSGVLYINPQVRVGVPWLFALITWKTNFKTSGILYGAGTVFQLSDSWKVGLSMSTGALSKKFKIGSPSSDSTLAIESRLTGLHLFMEKRLSDRLSLEIGPVLYFLKSKYSLRDKAIPNTVLYVASNLMKSHSILDPPYTIGESYDQGVGARKRSWVGIQAGLFFKIW